MINIKVSIWQKAIKEAKLSTVARGKVGAVIFTESGHIVTSAHNVTIWGKRDKWTIHAEKFALDKLFKIKGLQRYGKLNILICRYKIGTDTLANAKPCVQCDRYLRAIGLSVFYTGINGKLQKEQ